MLTLSFDIENSSPASLKEAAELLIEYHENKKGDPCKAALLRQNAIYKLLSALNAYNCFAS